MNRFADALIGATPADIAAHGVVNIGVGRTGLLGEQRHRGHDLSGLTIAALGNVFGHPGDLHRVSAVGGQTFDGGDLLARDGGDRSDATARGLAIDMHGASAAKSHTATELCAGHV